MQVVATRLDTSPDGQPRVAAPVRGYRKSRAPSWEQTGALSRLSVLSSSLVVGLGGLDASCCGERESFQFFFSICSWTENWTDTHKVRIM